MPKNTPVLEKPLRNRITGNGFEDPSKLTANPLNWRVHTSEQQQALAGAIDEIGFIRSVTVNKQTGCVLDGHLRVALAVRSGVTSIPVEYVDLSPEEEQIALATLDTITGLAATDKDKLAELLEEVKQHHPEGFDDERMEQLLYDIADNIGAVDNLGSKERKPNPRLLPLDVIYTRQGADTSCCLAALAGLKYGIASPHPRICEYAEKSTKGRHKVTFVDNDYFDYTHADHLEVVRRTRPKYCTVRDYMSEVQCTKAGIEYYPLEQILDWAEELSQYAENVIVIPKVDIIDRIPEKFMLGYSVPSSHGSTPLPVEAFRGRRIHLLGGSWKSQLAYLTELKDDVVSLDNNYVALVAVTGQFVMSDGSTAAIGDYFKEEVEQGGVRGERPIPLTNVLYVALALSFGCMAAAINEIYANNCPVAPSIETRPSRIE